MPEFGKQANTAHPVFQDEKTTSNNYSSSDDITIRSDLDLKVISGNKVSAGTMVISLLRGNEVTELVNETGSNTSFFLSLPGLPLQSGDVIRRVSTGTGTKTCTLRGKSA